MYSIRNIKHAGKVLARGATTIRAGANLNVWNRATLTPSLLRTTPNSVFIATRLNTYRAYSVLSSSPDATIYKYEDVKEIVSHPSAHPETVLVDVREPVEFLDGHIPGALNIPFKSSPGALDLSEEEFQENFGFDKPSNTKELVFYCLGGVRSTAAAELADTFGYKKRGNYTGSWEDWVEHENARK